MSDELDGTMEGPLLAANRATMEALRASTEENTRLREALTATVEALRISMENNALLREAHPALGDLPKLPPAS